MVKSKNDAIGKDNLKGVARRDIEQSLGDREAEENSKLWRRSRSSVATKPWPELISKKGYDFIVGWETGGKAYYEKVIKGKPIWPGYQSGITIGCGYDLGYHTLAGFKADWSHSIPADDVKRLSATIGLHTTSTMSEAEAKAWVKKLSDIVVSWDIAIKQFDAAKMPNLIAQLYGGLDNLDQLHEDSRSALLSLVFNRGPAFKKTGDRYMEMRKIASLMTAGTAISFAAIPAQFRSMKRIWGTKSSLSKRREEEAVLFENGLKTMLVVKGRPSAKIVKSPAMSRGAKGAKENHDDITGQTDDNEIDDAAPQTRGPAGKSAADVKWNANDAEQPDYSHLSGLAKTSTFKLTAEDLENLIAFNSFALVDGLVIFALRGARLVGQDKFESVSSCEIEDIRPNHREYRCVIGVLNRTTKKLWSYKASTVPNANAVMKCFTIAKSGSKNYEGNVLPTGCYTYTVGTHRRGTSGEIRGVLRLSKTSDGASPVLALRSLTDLTYDHKDFWDNCAPADNIHPGRRATSFSSLGCLTLPGDYDMSAKLHSGLWADLRIALGMQKTYQTSDDGKQFSCVLLTARDAAFAVSLRETGKITDAKVANSALQRLRFGSQGAAVAKLQKALGLAPDSSKLIGPMTRQALTNLQTKQLKWADGIYSPMMDEELGLGVFGDRVS